jgi:(heptosyl)LPS beta-1,4-glucosyltransferase
VLVLCLVLAGVWRVLGARGLGDEGIAAQARAGRTLVFGLGWGGLVSPLLMHPVGSAIFGLVVGAALVVRRARERAVRAQPIKRAQTLSATLITLNEADRVKRCLESLRDWVDEIIVLDSGSTDNTVDIARCYTDKVYVTDWPGYGLQKQRALEHATCDWVLSIDADEVVTPELRHDIDAALSDQPDCVGYRLPWGVVVYGKLLDFGRSARAPLRLFQRDGSRFTDAQVHETVKLPPGRVGTLDGRLLHYTHRDYGHALRKSAHYAWLGAQARFARGRRGGGLLLALLRSWWVFVQVYVFRLGLLDGQPGLLVALTYAQGSFNKYAGLWTLRRQAKHKSRD